VDFKSTHVLVPSSPADPKRRLLQALHDESTVAEDLEALLGELLIMADSTQAPNRQTAPALDGTWHLLGGRCADTSGATLPELALYSGGHFLHEGSIQNGALFKAILAKQVADVKLGVPQVTIADRSVVVSVEVASAPGKEKTLAYTAELTPVSPTSFLRTLTSLELPEPVGSLTPLVDWHDNIMVAYADGDLLVLQDETGCSEFLVHDSVQVFGKSDHLSASEKVFFQAAISA